MKVYVTGDRSMPTPIATAVFSGIFPQLVLRTLTDEGEDLVGGKLVITTGSLGGLESGVRTFLDASGIDYVALPADEDGSVDFDARAELVAEFADLVVFVHGDAMASHMAASFIKAIPDEKLAIVSPTIMTQGG